MNTVTPTVFLITPIPVLLIFLFATTAVSQSRLQPLGRRSAIVVDEKLSVLRASPQISGKLLRRIGRGRVLTIRGQKVSREGILFYQVAVTRRTGGWMQSDALIAARQPGEDKRLLRLIEGSQDFDLIARARIFLDAFPNSPGKPTVLMHLGEQAEKAAIKLSQDASRRLDDKEMEANGAPRFSYFLSYNGLDRYSRQGVRFLFDQSSKTYIYDGAAWREIVRRYPLSPEAPEARKRLQVRE